MSSAREILVIRHGALGDVLQCFGAFQAIRAHHPQDRLTFLTGTPFKPIAESSGLFDRVWTDDRPPAWRIGAWTRLVLQLRAARFDRVYDLQRKDRTALLFRMLALGRRIEWSGTARGASHRVPDPQGDRRHATAKFAEQLAAAGIPSVPRSDLRFLSGDTSRFGLPPRFAVLVPGASATRPLKRWPAERFGVLARALCALGLAPVIVGTEQEREAARAIAAACPEAIDLVAKTGIPEVASLCRAAAVTIGNDTGPMHLAALVGCPVVVLYSANSDPAMTAPQGPSIAVLQRERLADLPAEDVLAAVRPLIPPRALP